MYNRHTRFKGQQGLSMVSSTTYIRHNFVFIPRRTKPPGAARSESHNDNSCDRVAQLPPESLRAAFSDRKPRNGYPTCGLRCYEFLCFVLLGKIIKLMVSYIYSHLPIVHGRFINMLASHRRTRSSHPTEATQPPAPNKHQSTPVTNSVCLFMMPISAPRLGPWAGSRGAPEPSFHSRTVMS